MAPKIVFGHCFFSEDDVKLASLIPNIKDMELDSMESVLPLKSSDYTVKQEDDIIAIFQAERDSQFQALLSKALSWTSERSSQAGLELVSRSGRIYTLRKPSTWFRQLCENPEVREWLQEQIEDGNDVHFVVGLYTLFDASAAEGMALASTHAGNISVPVGEISGFPAQGSMDVGLSTSFKKERSSVYRFTAPGEQIFATRLKRVVFRFWKPHDLENIRLEKTSRWKMSSDNRGVEGDYSEVVEASLDDFHMEDEEYDDEEDLEEFTDDETHFYTLDG